LKCGLSAREEMVDSRDKNSKSQKTSEAEPENGGGRIGYWGFEKYRRRKREGRKLHYCGFETISYLWK
jgi:hypothetical protein